MRFWIVTTAKHVDDPRERAGEVWPGCTVLTFAPGSGRGNSAHHTALIHANVTDAQGLRSVAGIVAVGRAGDGPYCDARTRSTVRIWDEGAQIDRVPDRSPPEKPTVIQR